MQSEQMLLSEDQRIIQSDATLIQMLQRANDSQGGIASSCPK